MKGVLSMQQIQTASRRVHMRRALSLLLTAVMMLGLVPVFPAAQAAAHWADPYLSQLMEWGVINQTQAANPDRALTRADFMGIVNRAYGYETPGVTPFEDVKETDWYYDDVGIAYTARYIKGTSPTTASPKDPLTRETATTILGRNMMLQDSAGEILDFTDARRISTWAQGTIKSSLEHYLVSGYDDGTFRPQRNVSWGEMASMVTRLIGTPLQEPGDYALGGTFGNVTITSPGVTLRDTVVSGDLYITGGVGLGGVQLENVTVLGRIIASGTGTSEGGASILLRNVTADELLVDNLQNNEVSIRADGITEIGNTTVRTSAYIEDNTPEGLGLHMISLEGESYPEGEEPEDWVPAKLTLAGRIEEVVNRTPNSTVHAAKGTVSKLTVDEAAVGSNVIIDRGTVVKDLILDTAVEVTGEGDVTRLEVNAPGCVVEMLPDEIVIRPGITAEIHGEEMDSVAAEESTKAPMILAGYPEARDIIPTGLDAVFMTNKSGTVYWAVSAVTDGSVGEEDLIKPPSYGSIAVARGSVKAPKGNEEFLSKVAGLTPGASYYLSAVLVDARDQRSSTKVISFTTPDNTKPAFNAGYPRMSKVSPKDSVVVVMPNKDCKLYYALLPQGAVAPTENELKTGSVSGALGYGVRDVTKNTESTFRVNDQLLEEQTTYVIYFFLTDADGVNKSGITSITFTTDDETPPEFIIDPSAETAVVQDTSVRLNFRLNEDGTVYWVAVPQGKPYPPAQPGTGFDTAPLTSEYAKLYVSSGMVIYEGGKAGKVTARENIDGIINITGLEPESYYDFYYVAKDNAGPDRNYSYTVKKITIHTRDGNPPTVKQSFSPVSDAGNPKTTSNIYFDISEDVIYTGPNTTNQSLWTMFDEWDKATGDAKDKALNKLANALYNSFRLHKFSLAGDEEDITAKYMVGGDPFAESDEIDYTQARIEDNRSKNGSIRVVFPNSGLHLESGKQYCFEVNYLMDSSRNSMDPERIYFWDLTQTQRDEVKKKGHDVEPFIVDFPAAKLKEVIGLLDAPKVRDIAGAPTATEAVADLVFTMQGDSTGDVDPQLAYDILLWTNRPIEYNLYYRIWDKSSADTGTQTLSISGDDKGTVVKDADLLNGKYAKNLLDSDSGKNPNANPDENGWMLLGPSGAHYNSYKDDPEEYLWAAKSVGYTFSGFKGTTDGNKFPKLVNMEENLTYEFVISLTKWSGSGDRTEWTGKTLTRVYVDAGISQNLKNLGSSIQNAEDVRPDWEAALTDGITKGVLSIGAARPEKYLELLKSLDDTKIPTFAQDFPVLKPTSTKVDMDLALTGQGTIYWAIAEVQGTAPIVTTNVLEADGSKRPITLDEIPKARPAIKNDLDTVPQPKLEEPYNTTVMDPPPATRFVDNGSLKYVNSAVPDAGKLLPASEDLKPDTTYCVYFVLKGDKTEPSQVYIYQFTTNKIPKPQIKIKDNFNSSVDITIEYQIDKANYAYLVLTENNALALKPLYEQFSAYVDKTGEYIPTGMAMPDCYNNLTVLEALKQDYDYNIARNSGNANTNAYFPSKAAKEEGGEWVNGASVFDAYANGAIRETIDKLVWGASQGNEEILNIFSTGNGNTSKNTPKLQTIRNKEGQEIGNGNYVILVVAQDTKVYPNSPVTSGGRDGFKASVIKQADDSAPFLTGANLDDIQSEGTAHKAPFKGTISLTFNTEVYLKDTDPREPLDSLSFPASMPGGSVTVTPSKSGATNTYYLNFSGHNGYAQIKSETHSFMVNYSNGGADEDLIITATISKDKPTKDDPDPKQYIQFVVKWGENASTEGKDMFTLRRVYLDEIESGGTTTIQSFELQDINKNHVTSLTFEPGKRAEYVYAVLTPSDTTVPISWSEPSGIVSINGQGSAKQTAIITPKKVGSSTVSASLQSTVSILPPEMLTVTVKGKLANPTLKSNDTATVSKNADGSYTWKRADGKTHSATLTLDTGFLVDARDIEVTVANGTTGAVVTCGSITPVGGPRPTISVPLNWTEGDGRVTVTVSGKTSTHWVTPSVSVTIDLKSKPAEVTNLSLTTSEANSTITTGTGDGTYVWERTDNVAHTATLTFDTGIEMPAQDITVTSSDDTKIDCGTVSVSGTKASVKLTYNSGNSGNITITIQLKGVTPNKEIQITIKGINDSGTTIKPTPSGYR